MHCILTAVTVIDRKVRSSILYLHYQEMSESLQTFSPFLPEIPTTPISPPAPCGKEKNKEKDLARQRDMTYLQVT